MISGSRVECAKGIQYDQSGQVSGGIAVLQRCRVGVIVILVYGQMRVITTETAFGQSARYQIEVPERNLVVGRYLANDADVALITDKPVCNCAQYRHYAIFNAVFHNTMESCFKGAGRDDIVGSHPNKDESRIM